MQLYTVKQAMEILGIKSGTMYRLLAEHQIPHVKVGGRKQVSEEALRKYIDRQTSRPAQIDPFKGMKHFKYVHGMKVIP